MPMPKGHKCTRHKKGKNSTQGWTLEARARAAERMRRRRGNSTGINKPRYTPKPPKPPKPKKRGRPKKVWTAEKRKARSELSKKMWREASPEMKARMLANRGTNGFEKRTHEERVAFQAKVDQEAKGRKESATKKAKFASGEYDYLRAWKSEQQLAWWNSLPPEEQLERIYKLRRNLGLKRKHIDPQKEEGETKSYKDERYRIEQQRLYQLARDAMIDTGTVPKPKQGLGYYRQLIEFFRPDWVDWEI